MLIEMTDIKTWMERSTITDELRITAEHIPSGITAEHIADGITPANARRLCIEKLVKLLEYQGHTTGKKPITGKDKLIQALQKKNQELELAVEVIDRLNTKLNHEIKLLRTALGEDDVTTN